MKKITKMLAGVLVLLGVVLSGGRSIQASMPAELFYTLTEVEAFVDGNDNRIALSGRDVQAVGGPLEADAVGKNISFNLYIWQEALAKVPEKGINSIRYSCTVSVKNENGGYDQLAETAITQDTSYKYVYKIEKSGSYKFSFNEYHDDRLALSPINMEITVRASETADALNAPTATQATGQTVTRDAGTTAEQSSEKNADKSDKNTNNTSVSLTSVKINRGKISGKIKTKSSDIKAKIKIGGKKYYSLKIKKDGSFIYKSKQIKKGATIKIKLINGKKECVKKYKVG